MDAWVETGGILLLAVIGAGLGLWCSRQHKPFWVLGFIIPLGITFLVAIPRFASRLEFAPPFAWLLAGRTEFALAAFIIPLLLLTPLSRLPQARDRKAVLGLMLILLLYYCVAPFLAPAFNRGYWLQAQTRIDRNNICIQRTDYDCGPAAAVTALRVLGLPAHEGEIVILSHCTSVMGTPPDVLSNALQKRFGPHGLVAQYRYFDSMAELAEAGLVLAVIRHGLLEDHYVTVFKADAEQIIAGDPSRGLVVYPTAQFERVWRRTGIQLSRAQGMLVKAADHSSSASELACAALPAP